MRHWRAAGLLRPRHTQLFHSSFFKLATPILAHCALCFRHSTAGCGMGAAVGLAGPGCGQWSFCAPPRLGLLRPACEKTTYDVDAMPLSPNDKQSGIWQGSRAFGRQRNISGDRRRGTNVGLALGACLRRAAWVCSRGQLYIPCMLAFGWQPSCPPDQLICHWTLRHLRPAVWHCSCPSWGFVHFLNCSVHLFFTHK